MNKLNKKSIVLTLAILAISTFGVITIPAKSYAVVCGEGGCNTVYNTYNSPVTVKQDNPKPIINSISPSSSNVGVGTKMITISGEGFVPGSVARINGSNRPTTFIDNSHLLMQVTGNDMNTYRSNGGFFVTVFNGTPGGGYSNTAFFTINNTAVGSTVSTQNNNTSSNFTDTNQTENGNGANSDNGNNLASNAIFGSGGFYPSGLIQWIFFAILILLIVILVRKVYGADKRYHATQLKHD